MDIRSVILEELIVENRLQQVLGKFSTKRGKNLVNYIADHDPSGNQKYLAWIVNILTNNDDQSEQLISNNYRWKNKQMAKALEAVELFHKNQGSYEKKDLYQYKTLKELEKASEDVKKKLEEKKLEAKAKKGATKIYDDKNIFVVMPKTHEASCYYGRSSKWCTTQKNDGHYFNNYIDNGYLFYFIVKKPIAGDNRFYKMAHFLGVDEELIEFLDEPDYMLGNYDMDMVTVDDIFDDICYDSDDKPCMVSKFFDAPDDSYDHIHEFLSDNPYSDEVKDSFIKAMSLINEKYRPSVEEFITEMIKRVEKIIFNNKFGNVGSNLGSLSDILRRAGVKNLDSLNYGEAMEIIKSYLADNSDIGDNPLFHEKFPIKDR